MSLGSSLVVRPRTSKALLISAIWLACSGVRSPSSKDIEDIDSIYFPIIAQLYKSAVGNRDVGNKIENFLNKIDSAQEFTDAELDELLNGILQQINTLENTEDLYNKYVEAFSDNDDIATILKRVNKAKRDQIDHLKAKRDALYKLRRKLVKDRRQFAKQINEREKLRRALNKVKTQVRTNSKLKDALEVMKIATRFTKALQKFDSETLNENNEFKAALREYRDILQERFSNLHEENKAVKFRISVLSEQLDWLKGLEEPGYDDLKAMDEISTELSEKEQVLRENRELDTLFSINHILTDFTDNDLDTGNFVLNPYINNIMGKEYEQKSKAFEKAITITERISELETVLDSSSVVYGKDEYKDTLDEVDSELKAVKRLQQKSPDVMNEYRDAVREYVNSNEKEFIAQVLRPVTPMIVQEAITEFEIIKQKTKVAEFDLDKALGTMLMNDIVGIRTQIAPQRISNLVEMRDQLTKAIQQLEIRIMDLQDELAISNEEINILDNLLEGDGEWEQIRDLAFFDKGSESEAVQTEIAEYARYADHYNRIKKDVDTMLDWLRNINNLEKEDDSSRAALVEILKQYRPDEFGQIDSENLDTFLDEVLSTLRKDSKQFEETNRIIERIATVIDEAYADMSDLVSEEEKLRELEDDASQGERAEEQLDQQAPSEGTSDPDSSVDEETENEEQVAERIAVMESDGDQLIKSKYSARTAGLHVQYRLVDGVKTTRYDENGNPIFSDSKETLHWFTTLNRIASREFELPDGTKLGRESLSLKFITANDSLIANRLFTSNFSNATNDQLAERGLAIDNNNNAYIRDKSKLTKKVNSVIDLASDADKATLNSILSVDQSSATDTTGRLTNAQVDVLFKYDKNPLGDIQVNNEWVTGTGLYTVITDKDGNPFYFNINENKADTKSLNGYDLAFGTIQRPQSADKVQFHNTVARFAAKELGLSASTTWPEFIEYLVKPGQELSDVTFSISHAGQQYTYTLAEINTLPNSLRADRNDHPIANIIRQEYKYIVDLRVRY
jgi:hypothetical protein